MEQSPCMRGVPMTDLCVPPGSRSESSPQAASAPRSAWHWSGPSTWWRHAVPFPTRPGSAPSAGFPIPRCCPCTRSQAARSCCCSPFPTPNWRPWSPASPPRGRCGRERIVAHTSGANGIAVLSPLTEQDCIPLAIHPAMTFTGADEDIARLPDTCFGITAADDIGYAVAQSLVLEIGGEPFRVREDARPLYHAALAHASNHVVTVVLDAVEALRAALWGQELLGQELVGDAPGGIAERVVGPLARASLENALQRGQAALTGPVARGDAAAVADHLRALAEVDPELAQAYRANSLRTAQRAHAPAEVFAVLEDSGDGRDRPQAAEIRRGRAQRLPLAPRRVRRDAGAAHDRTPRHARADHGRPARRAPDAGAGSQARAGRGRGGVDLRQPAAVRRERRSRQIPEDPRRRPRRAARRRRRDRVHADRGPDVSRRTAHLRACRARWAPSWKALRGQRISREC